MADPGPIANDLHAPYGAQKVLLTPSVTLHAHRALDVPEQCCGVWLSTLTKRIDAMHAARLSLDSPPSATRVSATRIFFVGRYVPPHGQHAGPGPPWRIREGAERAERSETSEPRCARHTQSCRVPRTMEAASTSVAVLPRASQAKTRGRPFRANPLILLVEPNGIEPLTSTMPL